MPPRIVLVGIGKFGRNHLRVLRKLQSEGFCELRGVVDVRREILREINKNCNVVTSVDYRHFLDEEIDAMNVVTPTDTHYTICKECLLAGKHVLVEKPLTTSYDEAKELVQIAKNQGKILMPGHIFRYNSAVRKMKELIDKGTLGQIYYVFGHFMGLKNPRLDSGALFNFTSHHIDIYGYLLEKLPEEVTGCTGHFLGRKEFEDVAFVILRYPSGTLGIIEGSWLPPGKCRDLTIVGSRKSIISNLLEQTLELHSSRVENQSGQLTAVCEGSAEIDVKFEEPLELELLDFVECIKTGRKPLADAKAALEVVKIAEKALESARLKRSVKIIWQ